MTSPRKQPALSASELCSDLIPPVDFSFLSLQNVSEVLSEEPRIWNPKKSKLKKTSDGKFDNQCLRLNNNTLTDCSALMDVVSALFVVPHNLAWLDLSFNEFTKIDPIIIHFKNLQILYLHSNNIGDLKEVEKLAALPNLRKLTLHANPLDSITGYRKIVLAQMPKLQCIDFSVVTKAERATALSWYKMNGNKQGKKRRRVEDE